MTSVAEGPWFCDFNAGAPALPEVLDAFVTVERRYPANPASSHSLGRAARGVLEDARSRIASALMLTPDDVVFTGGGTEAANLAVCGLGDPALPVLLAPVEHPCVYEPAAARGVIEGSVDEHGEARLAPPEAPVGLVCLVHGQSELGTLQPVDQAIELARSLGVPLFVDAAQTLGRVALADLVASGAVVALSPHKSGGLRGHGVLAGRGLHEMLRPLMRGGGQESGKRPGTQSPALAAANALAIERALGEQPHRARCMRDNRAAFLNAVGNSDVSARVLTPLTNSLPNTAMLCFEGIDGRSLLPALDLAGVLASHGSACSTGSPQPPRILRAIGLDEDRARACVRFSFSWHERIEECRAIGARVGAVARRLRKKI